MRLSINALRENKMILLLFAIFISMSFASPYFLTGSNMINVLMQTSTYGIMACGMSFVIISAEFDLSIGSTMSLCGLISILLAPITGQFLAIVIALLAGSAIGLANGLLIARAKISSFIVTIGMMSLVKGLALKISGGSPVISQNAWFNALGNSTVAGIPTQIVIFAGVVFISMYVLSRTRFGRNIYAVGGNMEVAFNSGINVIFQKIAAFVICSFTAAAAGILLASRLNTGSALHGDRAALSVISGVVIGGTSLSGGVGSIFKSIIGILIFTLITNSLDLLRVFSYYQTAIRGALLILIIGIDAYTRNRSAR